MTDRQLVSLYPNSGAFGFPANAATHAVGWVTGDDPSIRPAARPLAVTVSDTTSAPAVALAHLAANAWRSLLPGHVWVTPKAHWAYELDFGSGEWLPDLLRAVGVDPDDLNARHDGSAVEFATDEHDRFVDLASGLLDGLLGSDFQLSFPGHNVVCAVHHHKQLWWTSTDPSLIATLREIAWSGVPVLPFRHPPAPTTLGRE